MATEEILAFNSQNNQNEIIRSLTQDVNLNQETKEGLQKSTINVNSWQQELSRLLLELLFLSWESRMYTR